jgi:ribose transport system substrate-binding protein
MKRVLLALSCMLFVGTLLFAGGQTEGKSKKTDSQITIGWSPAEASGVFATGTEYFEKAAADAQKHGLNVKIVTQAPTVQTHFSEQVSILEDFIARHVDAIVISPADVDSIKPAIKQANAQHIPVIIVNLLEPIQGVDIAEYIGFDNEMAGEVSGYAMLNFLGGPGPLAPRTGTPPTISNPTGHLNLAYWKNVYKDVDPATSGIKGKVAVINGIAGTIYANLRLKGFMEVVGPFTGVQVVEPLYADWNRQKAINAAQDIMQAHPDINAIWCASNEMGMGAELAVEGVHKQDQIKVLTNDGTPESVQMIKDHRLVAETWHGFPEWGWYGTEYGVMAALGQSVPQTFDIDPRSEYINNANDFYPNVKLDPIPWEKIKADYLSGKK